MSIKVSRINAVKRDDSIVAFADVQVEKVFINGFTIRESQKGNLYTREPMREGSDGNWYPIASTNDGATRKMLNKALLEAYQEEVGELQTEPSDDPEPADTE